MYQTFDLTGKHTSNLSSGNEFAKVHHGDFITFFMEYLTAYVLTEQSKD